MEAVVYEATNGHQLVEKTRSSKSESASCEEKQQKAIGDSCYIPEDNDDLVLENGLSRLPSTQPVDIQFENISFTASLGFRKGR